MRLITRPFLFIALFTASVHAQEVRRTPLTLTKGGTPENPAVFDGKGMIIDLGIDITDQDWIKEGDLWQSKAPLKDHPPVEDVQRAGLFIDEVPLRIVRDREAEKASADPKKARYKAPAALLPGQVGWKEDGSFYFRWPKEKKPGDGRVIQPPKGLASGVGIACSYIIVRNVTARHAANDGFNIHGARVGVRLENVKALSNGDEGISAHETVQMDVVDSEIAWNGSVSGGVADVNDSVTTYAKCDIHHNVNAAFMFDGKFHRVTNCHIHHQDKDIVVRSPDVVVEQSGNTWTKD